MSLREWMIILGVVILVGIVIDGLRRIWRARRDSLEISRGMGADDLDASPIDDAYNPELPNGGSRVLADETAEELKARMRQQRMRDNRPLKPTRRVVDAGAATQAQLPEGDVPLTASRDEEEGSTFNEAVEPLLNEPESETPPFVEPLIDEAPVERDRFESPHQAFKAEEEVIPEVTEEPEPEPAPREVFEAAQPQRSDRPKAGANRPVAQEVIIINVHSRSEGGFSGVELRKVFEVCGLEYGDMDIYHRHEDPDTTSPVQFSVANAVEPGTFEPARMTHMKTPGISFFMGLPGPRDPLTAFEFMLETANVIVRNMGGELKDERRSVMTPQTIEHCRQRIREFERKRRSVRV